MTRKKNNAFFIVYEKNSLPSGKAVDVRKNGVDLSCELQRQLGWTYIRWIVALEEGAGGHYS